MMHGSQMVTAKENLYSEPQWTQLQPSTRHQPTDWLKLYARAVIESEAWPTVMQLKRNP